MAEITLEPTVLSKVIPLSLKLNEVDSSLTGQLVTKQQFNTADTDAWFSFTLDGLAATTGTFDLTLINLQDKSVFNHDAIPFSTNPFYYKLDSGADELTNEIRHAGKWVGQLVVTLPNGDSATRKFIFSIEGHILDGTVVQTILLEDYNALIASIEASKDELAQYNIDYASLIGTVTSQEAARAQAELNRAETFDALVDSEMIAQNVATELQNIEATYAPRLLSAEQQLEQKIGGGNLATMGDLSQEVKTAMTGGSVAVVGAGAVASANLANDLKSQYTTLLTFAQFVAGYPSWNNYNAGTMPITNGIPKITAYTAWWYKIGIHPATVNEKYKLTVRLRVNSFTVSVQQRLSIAMLKYSVEEKKHYVNFNPDGTLWYNNGIETKAVTGNIIDIEIDDIYTGLISGNPFVDFKMSAATGTTALDVDILDYHIIRVPNGELLYNENNLYGTKYADYAQIAKKSEALTTTAHDALVADAVAIAETTYGLADMASPFNAKTWGAIGDSLTDAYFDLYVTYVASKTGMIPTNYGIGGTCVAQNALADVNPCFVDIVVGLNGQPGYTNQFDLWTIFGGANDKYKNTPIGTLTSTDPTTFYGALNLIIRHLQALPNHPQIVLITPYQFAGNYVTAYRTAIKAIGEAYGLPVIDLFAISQLSTDNQANSNYYTRDGIHPNQNGANMLRPLILKEFKNKINFPEVTTAMPH